MAGRKLYPKSTRVRLTYEEHRRISDRAKLASQSISRYLIESALREEAMTFDEKEHAEAIVFQRDWAINEVVTTAQGLYQSSQDWRLFRRRVVALQP